MTTLDRTPAHLIDMLGFVRELRAIVGSKTLEAYLAERILNLAVEILAHGYEQVDHETLYRTVTGELAAVEHALATCLGNLDDA